MKQYLIIIISIVLFFACEDKQEKDCAGVEGGTAVLDNCEQCVGGNTGVEACTEDCNGDFGGNATVDNCDNCVGGNTGVEACTEDCNGDFGGTAVLDCSGVCDGDLEEDCAGVCGGTAQVDCAEVCDGNAEILTYWYDTDNDGLGSDESQQFCNASVEEGWVLNDDDTDDNCTSNVHDCAGVCDGDSPDTDNDGICDWNDGDSYETVIIGEQEWMSENLKVTHYSNGDEILTGYEGSEWAEFSETKTGAYAVYPADDDNASQETCGNNCADVYGNLYNWYAVADERGVCPEEWHVPTDDEIKQLEMYLGMSQEEADDTAYRGTNEGSKLAGRADLWNDDDLVNNPEFGTSGFNFLPGGFRYPDYGDYILMGSIGDFWSSTENDNSSAWPRELNKTNSKIFRNSTNKGYGFSVRCVKD